MANASAWGFALGRAIGLEDPEAASVCGVLSPNGSLGGVLIWRALTFVVEGDPRDAERSVREIEARWATLVLGNATLRVSGVGTGGSATATSTANASTRSSAGEPRGSARSGSAAGGRAHGSIAVRNVGADVQVLAVLQALGALVASRVSPPPAAKVPVEASLPPALTAQVCDRPRGLFLAEFCEAAVALCSVAPAIPSAPRPSGMRWMRDSKADSHWQGGVSQNATRAAQPPPHRNPSTTARIVSSAEAAHRWRLPAVGMVDGNGLDHRHGLGSTAFKLAAAAPEPGSEVDLPVWHAPGRFLAGFATFEDMRVADVIAALFGAFIGGSFVGIMALFLGWGACVQSCKYFHQRWRHWWLCIGLRRVLISEANLPAEDKICCICLAPVREDVEEMDGLLILPCGHIFHYTCVYRWFEQRLICPACLQRVANLNTSFHAVMKRDSMQTWRWMGRASRPRTITCDHPVAYECLVHGHCLRVRCQSSEAWGDTSVAFSPSQCQRVPTSPIVRSVLSVANRVSGSRVGAESSAEAPVRIDVRPAPEPLGASD